MNTQRGENQGTSASRPTVTRRRAGSRSSAVAAAAAAPQRAGCGGGICSGSSGSGGAAATWASHGAGRVGSFDGLPDGALESGLFCSVSRASTVSAAAASAVSAAAAEGRQGCAFVVAACATNTTRPGHSADFGDSCRLK